MNRRARKDTGLFLMTVGLVAFILSAPMRPIDVVLLIVETVLFFIGFLMSIL